MTFITLKYSAHKNLQSDEIANMTAANNASWNCELFMLTK